MAFFKSGDELITEGNDLVKRKEFGKAEKIFRKAIDKKTKDTDLAEVMLALLSMEGNLADFERYEYVAAALRSKGDMEFTFGLHDVSARGLAKECDILAMEFRALSLSRDPSLSDQRGKWLIETAMKYQTTMPNDILVIPEVFAGVQMNGMRRALKLFAEGNEDLAENIVFDDPMRAAEYQQMAYNYRKQMGESGEANLAKVKGYSVSATCWFCGRDVTGEHIHFFPMSSSQARFKFKEHEPGHLPSRTESGDAVYACRGCYSAISRRADEIAVHYHNQAMQEIRNAEARLNAEISALNSKITAVSLHSR